MWVFNCSSHFLIWPKFTAYFLFYSLEAAGILRELANYLDAHISNVELIASAIGAVSAIIDNVPLVAATMGMYDLSSFPQDSEFWQLVAYCAGTGGSMLVIGSAAGVAFMGMEKIDFFWYFRKVCQSFAHEPVYMFSFNQLICMYFSLFFLFLLKFL